MEAPRTIRAISAALQLRPGAALDADYSGPRAAVAIVLREGAKGIELLLIRRSEHPDDPWSGQMAFPGGRHDPEDQDLIATAIRETSEEVGLHLSMENQLLGQLDELEAIARGRPVGLRITPYVFGIKEGFEEKPNVEVAELLWVAVAPLRTGERDATRPYRVGDVVYDLPGYQVGDQVVWGLTYRMLTELFGRMSAPNPDDT